MWIYVIMEHERYGDHSRIHSAYTLEETAEMIAKSFNEEQEEQEKRYNEWIDELNASEKDLEDVDDETRVPIPNDYFYMVKKTWLECAPKVITMSEDLSEEEKQKFIKTIKNVEQENTTMMHVMYSEDARTESILNKNKDLENSLNGLLRLIDDGYLCKTKMSSGMDYTILKARSVLEKE